MPDRSQTSAVSHLSTVVNGCLPRLRILSLDLDTYGSAENAAALRDIIEKLEKARPAPHETFAEMDFVVKGIFRIRRSQVAGLLSLAFDDMTDRWCEIVDLVEPPVFHFRASPTLVMRHLDFPLNPGGLPRHSGYRTGFGHASRRSGIHLIRPECNGHPVPQAFRRLS